MTRRADIDLLFGLLALQNGLIEQGTLFAAFTTWARDKGRTMAEILVGEGSLDSRERDLLEGLVAKHLERHGGDSGKSLASLSSIESVREELAGIGDPDLAASIPPSSAPQEDDPFRTVASYNVGASTSEGGRFRILRPHAAGGLGQVFVARDTELNRDVALKEIRERYADDPRHRTRFEFEAEITGGLEHPGIVPVYGLGSHADGRPYYAMRFIRGVTFKEAIAEFHGQEASRLDAGRRGLELRKLLRRFLDVCNAIDYAHQRGVIHRDLKPNNVMLGKHGETLVVDWGLAKAVGRPSTATHLDERTLAPDVASGSSETLPGSAIGTPGFMSPEQAAGEVDRVGPSSDVYSLGATLYALLTGRSPFEEEDLGRLLQMVRLGKFPPPRKLDRAIDPALEAICLKAMALSPPDRYPSARSLADDIERWMADEPVLALRDPLSVRAARWMRRHRTLAAGIAVSLVVAAASSSLGTWLIEGQRTEAVRQRGLAESNLARAREVVDVMYTLVAGQLEDVPRMDEYQRTILEKAREFYETEALPQSRDLAIRGAAATTQLRLGSILQKLGRFDEARATVGRARDLYDSLIRDDPAASGPRLGHAEALASLGRIEVQAREFAAAAGRFRQAIDRRAELASRRPAEPRYRLDLGTSWRELGQVLLHSRHFVEADSAYREALRLLEALAAEEPDDQACGATLADTLDDVAHLYTERNRDPECEALRRRSLALRRAALEARPADMRSRCDVARGLSNLGYTLGRLGRAPEAEAVLLEAIGRCEEIIGEHPELPKNRRELSNALSHHAALTLAGGKAAEAVASYRRALQVLRGGAVDPSGSAEGRSRVAALLHELARAERTQHLLDDAEGHARESIRACERPGQAGPGDPSILVLRGQSCFLLGLIVRDRGQVEEALESFRQAVAIEESVLQSHPDDLQVRGHLVEVLVEGLGKALRGLGRKDEALASYRRAAAVLAAIDPKDPTDYYNLACCLAQCSALGAGVSPSPSTAGGDADRAVEALRSAIEAGACTYEEIKGDTDLEPLSPRPDFRALMLDLAFPSDPFAG